MLKFAHFPSRRGLTALAVALASAHPLFAAEIEAPPDTKVTKVAAASNEGELAIKRFQVPPGFKVEVFAAEPDLANPVSFCVDEQGRFYVTETFRLHDGVTDIRGKDSWLDEDLACRTVDDRLAMMKRHLGDQFSSYTVKSDRIKLIEDRNGDGKADFSSVFADGFSHPLEGIGAGVLARGGRVWYANIPNLWSLRDTNGDGVADERTSLSYGYGVRVGFLGHDLHGLRMGPDGKLYFSIGDRGSNVQTQGRSVGHPDTGCVFRCNPDGSELEVFAYGLRNPQELVFDQYGNLFTGDNNSDGGDKARFVYVVEGGDSGWRVGYQFIDSPNSRGPWNSEKIWHPAWDGQTAAIVPPIANIADGPSGITYNPGTGLSDKYANTFFLSDFHGGKGSGILSFGVKPKGASFELVNPGRFIWECLPTDVDFGVEGGLYFTDWVQGWNMTGKGRIYHLFEEDVVRQAAVAETKKLLREGMQKRGEAQLVRLLGQPDMRVRQEAQFALADRGETSIKALAKVAAGDNRPLARLHAIWGLGQIGAQFKDARFRVREAAYNPLVPLLADRDAEVRAQAAKVLGDGRQRNAYDGLIRGLTDAEPRVRFFSAIALGRLGRPEAAPALMQFLRDNGSRDPYLRHAGVMGLVGTADTGFLTKAAGDSSSAARMGALLALRRLNRAEASVFLKDAEPAIVLEAARAINDQPLPGATQELARVPVKEDSAIALARRVVNANLRMGLPETAKTLAGIAADGKAPEAIRAEAVTALADWERPSGRDRVTGLWRPMVGERTGAQAREALQPALAELYRSAPETVQLAALRASERMSLTQEDETAFGLLPKKETAPRVRVQVLKTLSAHQSPKLAEAARLAAADESELVRNEGTKLQALSQPSDAMGALDKILSQGSVGERQNAITTLGSVPEAGADERLAKLLDQLLAGSLQGELELEVLDAAAKRKAATVAAKLKEVESKWTGSNTNAAFRQALKGGDAQAGRTIFLEKAEASCVRCHKVNGEGGEVGPELTGVGTRHDRNYILESILYPNKEIAAGFESIIVTLKNGTAYAGILKSENDKQLVLNSPEDGILTVSKADIQTRDRGLSAMPEGMGLILSKRELRDLVEFISTVK